MYRGWELYELHEFCIMYGRHGIHGDWELYELDEYYEFWICFPSDFTDFLRILRNFVFPRIQRILRIDTVFFHVLQIRNFMHCGYRTLGMVLLISKFIKKQMWHFLQHLFFM